MPSVMDDPRVVHIGPKPIEECPLESYVEQLSSGTMARLIPVKHSNLVSDTLVEFLTNEMNDEVCCLSTAIS